jgi:DinB superfamily
MVHNLQDTVALLSRTPGALKALLLELPDSWVSRSEGDGTWSVFGVVGHLIHGERTDWMPRAQRILQFGQAQAFDVFDRMAQEQESVGKSLQDLLEEFSSLRTQNLSDLNGMKLASGDLEKKGRHPTLGLVTLSQLLATWAAHDLTHLHQISRIMAHQYREAVGPWSAYLGVMHCEGHSA